jgi:hypothetical protein
MHFLIAWRVYGVQGTAKGQLETGFRNVLLGESYVEPFPGTIVVHVERAEERTAITAKVVAFAKEHPQSVQFIVTPASNDGIGYTGWLPKTKWPEIDRRSRPLVAALLEKRAEQKKAEPKAQLDKAEN